MLRKVVTQSPLQRRDYVVETDKCRTLMTVAMKEFFKVVNHLASFFLLDCDGRTVEHSTLFSYSSVVPPPAPL